MNSQLRMFDPVPPQFARARRTDSLGSHDAAAKIERTGSAKTAADRILAAVKRWPGCTTMELSRNAHIERYVVGRRTSEMEKAGLIRRVKFTTTEKPTDNTMRCAISEVRADRWYPA